MTDLSIQNEIHHFLWEESLDLDVMATDKESAWLF